MGGWQADAGTVIDLWRSPFLWVSVDGDTSMLFDPVPARLRLCAGDMSVSAMDSSSWNVS